MSYAATLPATRFATIRVYLAEADAQEFAGAEEFAGALVATAEQLEGITSASSRIVGDEVVLIVGFCAPDAVARAEAEEHADVLADLAGFAFRVGGVFRTELAASIFAR